MSLEKVYSVVFMRYTNSLQDTVSDWDGVSDNWSHVHYLKVTSEPFLLTESQLKEYVSYGGGFRSINFVGYIPVPMK